MKKLIVPTLFALLATGALHAATHPAKATTSPAPAVDLRAATGQTQFGSWYCSKLQDRCDAGDANACALYAKNCSD